MMTTQSSPTKILLKKLTVIPLLTGFLFLFAERIEAQKEQIETIYEQDFSEQNETSESEIYKEYVYQKGYIQTIDNNGNKINKKYTDLTEQEKKNIPPPPPLKSKKKAPSNQLINDLKDSKKYAIWIDGKPVKNEKLNNYKAPDFSNFFVSFVHKNARSDKFPQEYQASLDTHKYFDNQNKKRVADFEEYKKQRKAFKNAKWQKLPNGEEIKIIEVKDEEKTKEVIEKYGKAKKYKDSPIQKYNYPSSNGSQQNIPSKNIGTITDIRLKLKDVNALKINYSKEDSILIAYNKLASRYNKVPLKNRIIKVKDHNRLEELYILLSEDQKKNAQPFPKFPPPIKMDLVITYKKLVAKIKNTKKNRENNIIYLKSLYKKMSTVEKSFVVVPDVFDVLIKKQENTNSNNITLKLVQKLIKKRAVFYFEDVLISSEEAIKMIKKDSKISIQSESTNNTNYIARLYKNDSKKDSKIQLEEIKEKIKKKKSLNSNKKNQLDEIIEMAKNGAIFFYEKEKINSDKAIEILKKNKKLNIHSESTNNSNYKVWISKKLTSPKKVIYYYKDKIVKNSRAKKDLKKNYFIIDKIEEKENIKHIHLKPTIGKEIIMGKVFNFIIDKKGNKQYLDSSFKKIDINSEIITLYKNYNTPIFFIDGKKAISTEVNDLKSHQIKEVKVLDKGNTVYITLKK